MKKTQCGSHIMQHHRSTSFYSPHFSKVGAAETQHRGNCTLKNNKILYPLTGSVVNEPKNIKGGSFLKKSQNYGKNPIF